MEFLQFAQSGTCSADDYTNPDYDCVLHMLDQNRISPCRSQVHYLEDGRRSGTEPFPASGSGHCDMRICFTDLLIRLCLIF